MKGHKMQSRTFKLALLVTVASGVFTTHPSSARAQETPSTPVAEETVIVVTGQRLSNLKSISQKRKSDSIIESVSANEAGKLPDFNVGEALQRVPGINVWSYQGEPRFITMRGFNANYNGTTFDGFRLASPDPDGRKMFMDMFPSSFVQRIDVVKSMSPDRSLHAVGGSVDFVARSASKSDNMSLDLSGKLGEYLQSADHGGRTPSKEVEGTLSTRFGDHKQFGVVVNGSYWGRKLEIAQIEGGGQYYWYTTAGARTVPYGGNGYAVPSERRWYIYDNDRKRSSLTTKFDWQISEKLSAQTNLFYFKQSEYSPRNEVTAAVPTSATNTGQTETGGTLNNITQTVQRGDLTFNRAVYGNNYTLSYNPTAVDSLIFRAGHSLATSENPQIWDNFNQSGLTYNYSITDPVVTFTPVGSNATDYTKYKLNYHRDENQLIRESVVDLGADYAHGMKEEGFGFKLGVASTETNRRNDFYRTNYTFASASGAYTLASVISNRNLCPANCRGNEFPVLDAGLAGQAFATNKASMVATYDLTTSNSSKYAVDETIRSAYAMGRYQADNFTVLFGIRSETTSYLTTGNRASTSTSGTPAVTTTVWTPVSLKRSYSNTMPSVILNYSLSSNQKLRAAFSRALGRPAYTDMAIRGEVLNTTTSTPTLSRANPDIKPRVSDNYDASYEWYFDGGEGILSVGAFYKVISNELFTYGQNETIDVNGTPTQVLVTQARNSVDDAKVKGLEVNFVKPLTFLPAPFDGLGVSFNATIMDVDWPITLANGSTVKAKTLPEQAENAYNLTVFYQKDKWSGRIALNHTGTFWDTRFSNLTNATEYYRNRFFVPSNRLDLQIKYEVNDRLNVSLDGQNITDVPWQTAIGRDQEIFHVHADMAPAVFLGVSYKVN